ncbi:hypothetical protein SHA04_17880 [Staphylococcus haemolyticus]|uniref:Uncharacterized protein n=1 Tax=Staphylococcus haemolyticus (strain JCSC1435) TaxID=279808 RepID=Q4L7C8_STAHJ|nr:unnamed protein product [Staphylococcus haemolyticus JCSC1435]GEQ08911.1 hypothetical protein SHA04_17880 [Staphylococcus haemolyticus]
MDPMKPSNLFFKRKVPNRLQTYIRLNDKSEWTFKSLLSVLNSEEGSFIFELTFKREFS